MIQDRVCHTTSCGKAFRGGPRAYYCHECRIERAKQNKIAYLKRKANGEARALGSIDQCERCKRDYNVNAGTQRFCEDCQLIQRLEYDAKTSIVFYHKNKAEINPIRNERRRIGLVSCVICEKEFDAEGTVRKTWCEEHAREYINTWWKNHYYKSRGGEPLPPGALRLSDISKELGIPYPTLNSQYRAGKLPDPDGFNYLGAPYWFDLPHLKVRKRNINILSTEILSKEAADSLEPKTRTEIDRIRKQKNREERTKLRLCPQCGKPWQEPEANKKGKKPDHCMICQKYYRHRYEQRKKSPPTS